MNDDKLLRQFIESFSVLEDLTIWDHTTKLPPELDAGIDDSSYAYQKWRPAKILTERRELDKIYLALNDNRLIADSKTRKIEIVFPALYEKLVLNYRWLELDLSGFVRLFANPPGSFENGLLHQITSTYSISLLLLLDRNFIPFGKATDSFDPICFDLSRKDKNEDCPIVQIEHEAMLSFDRIEICRDIAESFQSFAVQIIEAAEQR